MIPLEFIWTLRDIIGLILIGLCVLGIVVLVIWQAISRLTDKLFKKPCHRCKHYYLKDVPSCGDGCTMGCKLNRDIRDWHTSSNWVYKCRKCDKYETK